MKSAKHASKDLNIIQYADDRFVAIPVFRESEILTIISEEIAHMNEWCRDNGLHLNLKKTESRLIPKKLKVILSDTAECDTSDGLKILGLTYNSKVKRVISCIAHRKESASPVFSTSPTEKRFTDIATLQSLLCS